MAEEEEDPYQAVTTGLKLKGVDGSGIRKKKKKKKNKASEIAEQSASTSKSANLEPEVEGEDRRKVARKTAAEVAFEAAQETRKADRVLVKASKTHKQQVESLNEYLGNLSEHYDIAKVSWTK